MKAIFGGIFGAAVLLAGSANAADLAVPAYKAPVAPPAFSWTGWYIGGNIGGGWGAATGSNVSVDGSGIDRSILDLNSKPNGIIGGGQIGYDWQVSPSWLFGVVADFQGANIKGAAGLSELGSIGGQPATLSAGATQNLQFLGTVRGRLGWTAGNWLVYGSGGVAYGSVSSTDNLGLSVGGGSDTLSGSSSETRFGWAGGAGVNYALSQNWIVGVDYLHYDLGHTSVTGSDTFGNTLTVDQKVGGDIVRGIVNYKF